MPEDTELRRSALTWLSRRDYSEQQLCQKLLQKEATQQQAAVIIEWCKKENYLNEARFVSMLVRSRANKGYGYLYLLQECRQQQISAATLSAATVELNIDWYAVAVQCYQKKYRDKPVSDYHDQLKRMAYLQRRGFTTEQIQFALTAIE